MDILLLITIVTHGRAEKKREKKRVVNFGGGLGSSPEFKLTTQATQLKFKLLCL